MTWRVLDFAVSHLSDDGNTFVVPASNTDGTFGKTPEEIREEEEVANAVL